MSTPSSFSVRGIHTRDDMDTIADLTYVAFHQPYFTGTQMMYPVFGYTPQDLANAFAEWKERIWKEHTSDDPRDWVVVEDTAIQKIVSAVAWKRFECSPFPDGKPKLDFHWWPSGDAKDFCEEMFQQMITPRCLWMQRPHAVITHVVVHPEYRARGVGTLMMKAVGVKLDENGLEGFTEATELGRVLYEKTGFRVAIKLDFYLPVKKSELWARLEHDLKMPPNYAMWRPLKGVIEPGERDRPWL